jgi:HprK-related kinase B
MRLNRKTLIADLRRSYPTPHRVDLSFGACRITVWVGKVSLFDALINYYRPFVRTPQKADITISVHEAPPPDPGHKFTVKEPEPGKTRVKEEYIDMPDGRMVQKRLTGMMFIFGCGEHLAIGPCLENLNQVVNFINNRHIEWQLCRSSLLGHAAAVSMNGRGLALAGFSGAGKSTLALHMMGKGTDFVSNDRLMIHKADAGLTMLGVAKLPRINPGTILHNPYLLAILSELEQHAYRALKPEKLRRLEHKYDASIEDLFGPGRFRLEAPMTALVILNWQHNRNHLRIQPFQPDQRRDLLNAFMKPTGLFFYPNGDCRMPAPTYEKYIDFLNLTELWEFSGGVDFEAATMACCHFLEQGVMAV